jgi:hypothetical protein
MHARPLNAKPSHSPLLLCYCSTSTKSVQAQSLCSPLLFQNSNQHCKHQLAKVQVFSPRRSHVEPTHVEPKHPPDSSGFGRQYFAQPYWHVAIEDRLTCRLGADVCMLIDGRNSNWLNLAKLIQYLCEAKSEGNML